MTAKVLSISSQVAYGPVGNSAAVPAMEALGLTVYALPTIVLSNHPGHGRHAGIRIPAFDLSAMIETLTALGILSECAGIMTGYFAADDQIRMVAQSIRQMKKRNPSLVFLCDPVIGDRESGLYVVEAVANAIRDELVPLADCTTPNAFELEWLTGSRVTERSSAASAARKLAVPMVVATSVPDGREHLLTLSFGKGGDASVRSRYRQGVPHGTGDLFSGLFLAHLLLGHGEEKALTESVAMVETIIDASSGSPVLRLDRGLR